MRAITFGSSAIPTASGRAACGLRARVGTVSCILTLGELTWRLCNKPLGNSIGLPLVLRLSPRTADWLLAPCTARPGSGAPERLLCRSARSCRLRCALRTGELRGSDQRCES